MKGVGSGMGARNGWEQLFSQLVKGEGRGLGERQELGVTSKRSGVGEGTENG